MLYIASFETNIQIFKYALNIIMSICVSPECHITPYNKCGMTKVNQSWKAMAILLLTMQKPKREDFPLPTDYPQQDDNH